MEARTCARAIFDYEERAPDELSFKRNDIIMVLCKDEEDEGWYYGTLRGKMGLVPNNYVQFQEGETPPPVGAEAAEPNSADIADSDSSDAAEHEGAEAEGHAGNAAGLAAAAPPAHGSTAAAGASQLPDWVREVDFAADYAMAEALGRGRFSQVRRCTQAPGGEQTFAVKIMDLSDPELGSNAADSEREVLAEVRVLRGLRHPGIVQLVETIRWGGKYFLVTEDLAGGDLFDRIEHNGPFKEDAAAPIVRQITTAIAFMHSCGVAHRDIKPSTCGRSVWCCTSCSAASRPFTATTTTRCSS